MLKKKKKIIIIGAGGHARMIATSILKNKNMELAYFISDYKKTKNETIFNIPVVSINNIKNKDLYYYIVGIGNNKERKNIYNNLKKERKKLISIIDNTAIININVSIKKGCFIAPGVIINTGTVIKKNTIINTGSIIEHDCQIGKNCHLAPGIKMAGYVKVGNCSFIGIGSSIKDKISIGNNVTIGMGSVVINNIKNNIIIVGIPAKKIIKKNNI